MAKNTLDPPLPDARPMTICHVISGDLWAGAECQAAMLLGELRNDSTVDVSAITFNPGRLTDELNSMGIPVTRLDEKKSGALELTRAIRNQIRQSQFDILHAHGYKEHILASFANLRLETRASIFRTLHGMPEPCSGVANLKHNLYLLLENWALRTATDRVVVVSQDMQDRLSSKPWANKMTYIPNGIARDKIAPAKSPGEIRDELGVNNGDFLVGTAGRLVEVKRLDRFLQVAKEVGDAIPEARFVIAGDGPLRADLEEKARHLGIEKRISFLGTRDDIYDVLNTLDLFLMTSDHEGLPMVVLECVALRVPMLLPAVGGIPEVLGVDSPSLYRTNNPEEIAQLVLRCNKTDRETLSANVTRTSADKFSATTCAQQYCDLYVQCCGQQ